LKSDWDRAAVRLPQGALVAVDLDSLKSGEAAAQTLFEPRFGIALGSVSLTRDAVVLDIIDEVTSRIDVLTLSGGEWQRRPLEAPAGGSIEIASADATGNRFYFYYEGYLTPPTLYEADALERTSASVKRQPDFFDTDGMRVQQLTTRSADGTEIPYFLVTPRDFEADGQSPTLLYGYGGFEISMMPSYSATVGTAWLERGGVYVVANIRGGGEFGPAWHQAALREHRQRAYDDFIAVAEDLIARGITSPEHLGISGGSNGGLLVAAVVVQRPDLFNAVVCQVPLLDMRRYHLLLAGASWMAEFGDPDDPDDWAFISRYSPYQNVSADVEYPEIYFFTSTRDDRVHPGHARKMVARMEAQGHAVLYYENIEGGHGGAANLNQSALNQALAYTYLRSRLVPRDRQPAVPVR
jgi:prolyl oligopeptidase